MNLRELHGRMAINLGVHGIARLRQLARFPVQWLHPSRRAEFLIGPRGACHRARIRATRGADPVAPPQSLTENAANEMGAKAKLVMPGLVPGIHVLASLEQERRGWPGRSPAMTKSESFSSG